MLVIDGIQNVAVANGVVRLQVTRVASDGKSKGVEEIAIPSTQFATVVQALQQAGQNLQQRLQEQQKQQGEGEQQAREPAGQQPAAEPAEQGDNFQF